jgi:hypothetical protein
MNDPLTGERLNARLGSAAALTIGALFLLYVVCFAGILLAGPMFVWKDLQGFLDYSKAYDQTFKYVSYAGMLLFCFAWVALSEAVRGRAGTRRLPFARMGAAFGSLFAAVSGMNYFVQLTCVRLSLAEGFTEGFSQLVMSNPISAMESVNMLGWTFLLGLSCLFLGLSLEGGNAARTARAFLLATAAACIAGGFGFALNCTPVVGICMYPLLGGGVIGASASLAGLFRAEMRAAPPEAA